MAYLLRMSDEIHDWLTELRGTDPPAAALVGQALAALMTAGSGLGPPLVTAVADAVPPTDLSEALHEVYREKTAHLLAVQGQLDQARRLPGADGEERRLAEQVKRLQDDREAFMRRREALRAAYSAAQASLRVQQLLVESGQAGGEDSGGADQIAEAEAKVRDVTAEIERELGLEVPEGLMELSPGDVDILFAVEPAGTALLLAVLEGPGAVRDQHSEAVALSAEVLQLVRAGQAPEAAARAYDHTQSFLDDFFPGEAGELLSDAAALAARNQPRTLAEQRARLGLSQAEVAERMGVRQERVSAIERAQHGAMEVRTLAAYVEALGGRLRLVGEFSDEDVPLR